MRLIRTERSKCDRFDPAATLTRQHDLRWSVEEDGCLGQQIQQVEDPIDLCLRHVRREVVRVQEGLIEQNPARRRVGRDERHRASTIEPGRDTLQTCASASSCISPADAGPDGLRKLWPECHEGFRGIAATASIRSPCDPEHRRLDAAAHAVVPARPCTEGNRGRLPHRITPALRQRSENGRLTHAWHPEEFNVLSHLTEW